MKVASDGQQSAAGARTEVARSVALPGHVIANNTICHIIMQLSRFTRDVTGHDM